MIISQPPPIDGALIQMHQGQSRGVGVSGQGSLLSEQFMKWWVGGLGAQSAMADCAVPRPTHYFMNCSLKRDPCPLTPTPLDCP